MRRSGTNLIVNRDWLAYTSKAPPLRMLFWYGLGTFKNLAFIFIADTDISLNESLKQCKTQLAPARHDQVNICFLDPDQGRLFARYVGWFRLTSSCARSHSTSVTKWTKCSAGAPNYPTFTGCSVYPRQVITVIRLSFLLIRSGWSLETFWSYSAFFSSVI